MWFSWNPRWLAAGASLWCVAAKAAYVTTCTVGTVLRALVGASETSRLPTWAASNIERANVAAKLDVARETVDEMFLDSPPGDLERRARISLQLRWCPECAKQWYHCVHFQDRRVLRCPWHGSLLFEGCSKCGRPVDPLGKPWQCAFCGTQLAPHLDDWVRLLKSAPGHAGAWPSKLAASHSAYVERHGELRCHGGDLGRAQFDGRDWALRYWQQGQLYESGCALWDSVLADHKDCYADEPGGYMPQYYSQGFVCPVAAAAGAVLGSLGGCMEAPGLWPRTALPTMADGTLPWPESVSFELMRGMLRELPRRWLVDALMLFGDLAAAERSTGRWEPAAGPLFKSLTGRGVGSSEPVLLQILPAEQLLNAKSYAAVSCPRHPAESVLNPSALLSLS